MFIYTPIKKLSLEQMQTIRNHPKFKCTMQGDCYGIFSNELSMWHIDSENGVEVTYSELMKALE